MLMVSKILPSVLVRNVTCDVMISYLVVHVHGCGVLEWICFILISHSHSNSLLIHYFAEVAVEHVEACSVALEAAGAGILQRKPLGTIGSSIAAAGADLQLLSTLITALDADKAEAKEAGQRLTFAAEKMIEAGNALQGVAPKPSGKSWLKGGNA
jgi:hypothetical protein